MVDRSLGYALKRYFGQKKDRTEEENYLLHGIQQELGYFSIYPLTNDCPCDLSEFDDDDMAKLAENVGYRLENEIADALEAEAKDLLEERENEFHDRYCCSVRDETTGEVTWECVYKDNLDD